MGQAGGDSGPRATRSCEVKTLASDEEQQKSPQHKLSLRRKSTAPKDPVDRKSSPAGEGGVGEEEGVSQKSSGAQKRDKHRNGWHQPIGERADPRPDEPIREPQQESGDVADRPPGEGRSVRLSRKPRGRAGPAEPPPTPPDQQTKQKASETGPSFSWASMVGSLILGAVAGGLMVMPVWTGWLSTGNVPIRAVAIFLAGMALVAFLLFTRHLVTRVIAVVVFCLLLLFCVGAILVPCLFPESLSGMILSSPELRQVADAPLLAGASVLYLAAALLATGGGAVRWTLSAVLVAAGISLPLTPVQKLFPQTSRKTVDQVVVTFDAFQFHLPSSWSEIRMEVLGEGGRVRTFQSPRGALLLTVRKHTGEAATDLAAFSEELRQDLRVKYPDAGSFECPVKSHLEQRKIVVVNDRYVEIRVVKHNDTFYTFRLTGSRGAYERLRSQIRVVFGHIQYRPSP